MLDFTCQLAWLQYQRTIRQQYVTLNNFNSVSVGDYLGLLMFLLFCNKTNVAFCMLLLHDVSRWHTAISLWDRLKALMQHMLPYGLSETKWVGVSITPLTEKDKMPIFTFSMYIHVAQSGFSVFWCLPCAARAAEAVWFWRNKHADSLKCDWCIK